MLLQGITGRFIDIKGRIVYICQISQLVFLFAFKNNLSRLLDKEICI